MQAINRIHHITAIVGPAGENLAFYHDLLGLRLVKRTVNFEDPATYHLYYGDDEASAGTIITFFPWANAKQGKIGAGQVGRTAFRVPAGSFDFWRKHFNENNLEFEETTEFNAPTLAFTDPHGLLLALVESSETRDNNKIIGFHGASLFSEHPEKTRATLFDDMGLLEVHEDAIAYHLETIGEEKHHIVIPKEVMPRGTFAVGTVHHIAWSVPDAEEHKIVQETMYDKGYLVTEIKDRKYFDAIYFREKGRIMFEVATDKPGFTVDEPLETLGEELKLPDQFESHRAAIEATLDPLNLVNNRT